MTRKTIALLLALCLGLSLTVIALAAEPEQADAPAAPVAAVPSPGADNAAEALAQIGVCFQQLQREVELAARQTRNTALAAAAAKSVLLVRYGGVMAVDGATLYDAAAEDAQVLRTIPAGKVGRLEDSGDGWYKVSYDTCSGYLKAEDCQAVRYEDYVNSSASSLLIDDLLKEAYSYLGTPYVYGGVSHRGIDCSGFTMQVFGRFGYSLPHSANAQYRMCRRVSDSERRPGDLVFFNCDGVSATGHVGIYLGGGRFIHAGSITGVAIRSLSESYFAAHYTYAARLIGK